MVPSCRSLSASRGVRCCHPDKLKMQNSTNEAVNVSAPPSVPTIAERYFQVGVYLTFTSTSFVGYVWMACGIARCKETRSRFYYILIFLLLSRAGICVQLFNLIVYRLLRLLNLVSNPPRYVCSLLAILIYPGFVETVLLIGLAIDRAVALFAISYYRKLSRKQVVKACLLASGVALIFKVGMLFGTPAFSEPVGCLSVFDAMGKEGATFAQHFEFSLIVVLLVVYMSMLAAIHARVKRLKMQANSDALLATINRQMALMPTLRNIVVIHCFWTFTSKLLLTISVLPSAASFGARCVLYAGCFICSELFVNIVTLLKTNEEVRRATINCFRANKVQSISTPHSPQTPAAGSRTLRSK